MSGAQIAHWLKVVGKGSELTGIRAVYRAGWLAGAGQATAVLIGGCAVFCIGKWGYEKLQEHLHEQECLAVPGEVV